MCFLERNFEEFKLPRAAIDWLMQLWHVTQVFDDFADGDPVERGDLDKAIFYSLVSMNVNSFYRANIDVLAPVVANFILKWKASDAMERDGKADERSFVWRSGYYDVVNMVVLIVHGVEGAFKLTHFVLQLYGETYEEYKKEFP